MSFKAAYQKLLSDPTFGHINHRERHAREMYLAGMKRSVEVCEGQPDGLDCINAIEQAIAEESK